MQYGLPLANRLCAALSPLLSRVIWIGSPRSPTVEGYRYSDLMKGSNEVFLLLRVDYTNLAIASYIPAQNSENAPS